MQGAMEVEDAGWEKSLVVGWHRRERIEQVRLIWVVVAVVVFF